LNRDMDREQTPHGSDSVLEALSSQYLPILSGQRY
jgi:hypothetical protein